jgi:hypothetical protein
MLASCARATRGGFSVWFFWMNSQSDQPDRRDRLDEPVFVGRAQSRIDQATLLDLEQASQEGTLTSDRAQARITRQLSDCVVVAEKSECPCFSSHIFFLVLPDAQQFNKITRL